MSTRRPPTTYGYLDASALVRRAEAKATPMTDRIAKIAGVLEPLLADPNRQFACSELTLLEFHNSITVNLRTSDRPEWDTAWWLESREMLFSDVASGKVLVLATPPKTAEHVMSLVTLFTRDHNRALRAWDAMHVVIAARWAYDLDARVELVTSDQHFEVPFLIGELGSRLHLVNLDVLAGTGVGADCH
jgi:hypothetical protein